MLTTVGRVVVAAKAIVSASSSLSE